MTDLIAYGLREEYADTYEGGVLSVGDTSFDVGATLAADGVIVVDPAAPGATLLLNRLDEYPPLERREAGRSDVPVEVPTVPEPLAEPLEDHKRDALDAEARRVGASEGDLFAAGTKADVAALIRSITTPAPAAPEA